MKQAYFITGTDTGVGKTAVACGLARALRSSGIDTGVMKPVETGCPTVNGSLVPQDALKLKEASGSLDALDLINPYRFPSPLAPEIASRNDGVTIEFEKIKESFETLCQTHEAVLVEGAGGLLVPVSKGRSMADLALYLGLPVIIVASNRLGVINHTLLTIHYARSMGIAIKGVLLNNTLPPDDDPSRPLNFRELKRLSDAPVLAEVPFIKKEALTQMDESLFEKLIKAL